MLHHADVGSRRTKRVGDKVQSSTVLLHDLPIQARQVEAVEDVIFVNLGEIFLLLVSLDSRPGILLWWYLTLPLVLRNHEIHLID